MRAIAQLAEPVDRPCIVVVVVGGQKLSGCTCAHEQCTHKQQQQQQQKGGGGRFFSLVGGGTAPAARVCSSSSSSQHTPRATAVGNPCLRTHTTLVLSVDCSTTTHHTSLTFHPAAPALYLFVSCPCCCSCLCALPAHFSALVFASFVFAFAHLRTHHSLQKTTKQHFKMSCTAGGQIMNETLMGRSCLFCFVGVLPHHHCAHNTGTQQRQLNTTPHFPQNRGRAHPSRAQAHPRHHARCLRWCGAHHGGPALRHDQDAPAGAGQGHDRCCWHAP